MNMMNMMNNMNNNMNNMNNPMNNPINNSYNNNFFNNNNNMGNINNNNMAYSAGNVNINNNNNNSNNNNNNNNQQEPIELIPRVDKVIRDKNMPINDSNMVNISFDASTGLKVIITTPKNITIKELVKKYINKIGISETHIGKDIIFLFNGGKLEPYSEETINGFQDFSSITVFDQNNVIGA